jgi:membrane dipeptidase
VIVDAHNDLLLELVLRRDEDNPFGRHWLGQLRDGGVGLQVCPLYTADVAAGEARATALRQVEAFDRAVADNAEEVFAVRTRADLERVAGEGGRIGLMLSMEGTEPLEGDVGALDDWFERGVRMIGLTWNHPTAFAGGLDTPEDGLTAAGSELVGRFAELGIVLDLAHASEPTFDEALALAEDGRVVVSHAGCRAVHDHVRNLSDAQLEALAAKDGALGMMALTLVVGRDTATLDRFLDHLDHAVTTMGIGRVGLGADFIDQVIQTERASGKELEGMTLEALEAGGGVLAIRELTGPADYPRLVEALRARGYDGGRLDSVLHGSFLRVLAATLPS